MTDIDHPRNHPTPIHRRIAQRLAAAIEAGDYAPGSRLPSEATLVREFGVSRGTLRHALSTLRAAGLIEAVPTRGTFVRSATPATSSERRRTIGVVVPSVARPYVPDLLVAIEDELHARGYSMVVGSSGSTPQQQAGRIRRILDDGVAGLIAYPIDYEPDPELYESLVARHFPVVLVDRHLVGHDLDAVVAENVGGAHAVVSHLVGEGFRRIAFVSTDNVTTTSVAERLQGYEHALTAAGIPLDRRLVFTDIPVVANWGTDYREASRMNAARIAAFLERTQPDAVFALHDHLALEVVVAARSLGRQVPEELGVAGFDDDPLLGELALPLTTVAQPRERIGREAAAIVVDRIEGRRSAPARIVLPTRLVVRASTLRASVAAASA
ncbi:MAG TPA: GntR family transcriptional regulator [Candidatus Limnocylindrales bacterium]